MARLLPIVVPIPLSPFPAATFFFFMVIGVSVFSVVTFLCASHKRGSKKTAQLGERKPRLGSSISSKARLMAKMISWRKVHGEEGDANKVQGFDDDADEDAVWKRTIIMGERCRPVDFSGQILYDSQGNPLPETSPSRDGQKS